MSLKDLNTPIFIKAPIFPEYIEKCSKLSDYDRDDEKLEE